MTTLCFKERSVQRSNGQLLSATIPWWSGLGSQSSDGQSSGAVGPVGNKVSTTKQKQTMFDEETVLHEDGFVKFTIFPGGGKRCGNGAKNLNAEANISMQTVDALDQGGYFSLGFAQPMICGKIPYGDPNYNGLFSTHGHQFPARIMLQTNNDDGPVYVNAKQYHGILRRRLSRAKAISQKKTPKVRKPYMHLSRHLHAVRRPRGCGGRFLNTKTDTGNETTTRATKLQETTKMVISQTSEVVQSSDCGNLIIKSPSKDVYNGYNSNISSCFEVVTSDSHQLGHIRSPHIHDFSGMLSTAGHGRSVMPSKWLVATTDP